MRIKLVAAQPKAQRQAPPCKECPLTQQREADIPKLVTIGRSNFCLDTFRSRRLRNISAASSESETQSMIGSASSRDLDIDLLRHKDGKPTIQQSAIER
jgi:hypothetical protein